MTVGWRRIDHRDIAALLPAEASAVLRSAPKRRREFATGRALLHQLTGITAPIRVLSDRRPDVPDGVVASLAHDDDYAVAAVSRDPHLAALGIDIEPTGALDADVARLILRHDESALDAHLAFTLKEAAYKAWCALGGRTLDHHDVRLELQGERFRAEVVGEDIGFDGRYVETAGRWLALVVAGP